MRWIKQNNWRINEMLMKLMKTIGVAEWNETFYPASWLARAVIEKLCFSFEGGWAESTIQSTTSIPINHKSKQLFVLNLFDWMDWWLMNLLMEQEWPKAKTTPNSFINSQFLQLPPQSINKINWVAVAEEMELIEWRYYNSK